MCNCIQIICKPTEMFDSTLYLMTTNSNRNASLLVCIVSASYLISYTLFHCIVPYRWMTQMACLFIIFIRWSLKTFLTHSKHCVHVLVTVVHVLVLKSTLEICRRNLDYFTSGHNHQDRWSIYCWTTWFIAEVSPKNTMTQALPPFIIQCQSVPNWCESNLISGEEAPGDWQ